MPNTGSIPARIVTPAKRATALRGVIAPGPINPRPRYRTERETASMAVPVISFDESGNSGQNLLDPQQPVFVLASVDVDDAESRELLGPGQGELHFSSARRSAAGRRRIVRVLQALEPAQAQVAVVHKSFMITAKIVDDLVETTMHEAGFDCSATEWPLALATLWHTVLPVVQSPDVLPNLQALFVRAVRRGDTEAAADFYELVDSVASGTSGDAIPAFDILAASRPAMADLVGRRSGPLPTLEPGIPTVAALAQGWARRYPSGFTVRHDDRPEVGSWLPAFSGYFGAGPARELILDAGTSIQVPVPVNAFELRASHAHPAIQVADVVASALRLVLHARVDESASSNAFVQQLDELGLDDLVVSAVWPDSALLDQ